jgi:hypothetical protein
MESVTSSVLRMLNGVYRSNRLDSLRWEQSALPSRAEMLRMLVRAGSEKVEARKVEKGAK